MEKCKLCGEMVDWDNPAIHYGGHKCRELKPTITEEYKPFGTSIDNYIPPMETLPTGGKQAKEPYNYALLPKEALHLICLNMTKGAEVYGVENYLDIPYSDNASRAVAHLQLATMTEDERKRFSNEDTEKHLINGATRALFALDCYIRRVKAQAFYDGEGVE